MGKKRRKKKVVAGLVVRRQDGKILVIKRVDGRWDLPKGHVDKGEKPYAAAHRETWEETKLRPKSNKSRLFKTKKSSGKTLKFYPGRVGKKPNVTLDPAEHVKYRWVTKEKAVKLLRKNKALAAAVKKLAEDEGEGPSEGGLYVVEATSASGVGPFLKPVGEPMDRKTLTLLRRQKPASVPNCKPLQPPDPDCNLAGAWARIMNRRRPLGLLKKAKRRAERKRL